MIFLDKTVNADDVKEYLCNFVYIQSVRTMSVLFVYILMASKQDCCLFHRTLIHSMSLLRYKRFISHLSLIGKNHMYGVFCASRFFWTCTRVSLI